MSNQTAAPEGANTNSSAARAGSALGKCVMGVATLILLSLGLSANQALASGCANESLRAEIGSSFLPECRAYELVSPSYKENYAFNQNGYSRNGERLLANSLGSLAGVSGEQESAEAASYYALTRTGAGWHAEPLNPSASLFPGQALISGEADSGESLWALHTSQQSARTADLYVRGAGGSLSAIGPLVPPQPTAGAPSATMNPFEGGVVVLSATSNYSHVIFAALTSEDSFGTYYRWPGDETKSSWSLYEYDGADNSAPTLVGVTGPVGSKELVGECGTGFGSESETTESGTVYDALSASGETVFFTPVAADVRNCGARQPAVAEVYARLHGSQTVNISLPSETECGSTCLAAEATPYDKHFEGASEDGTKAFFASTQALINGASEDTNSEDSASTRGCANTEEGDGGCNLYEYDFANEAGHRLVLVAGAAEVQGVARISRSGEFVYFVAKGALTPGLPNEYGHEALVGSDNLYVYDSTTGTTKFIATLSPEDAADWGQEDERPVQATSDGSHFIFASSEPELTPDDHTELPQLFEYSAGANELVRISIGEDGYNEDGNAVKYGIKLGSLESAEQFNKRDFHLARNGAVNMSEQGITVVFESRGKLTPTAFSAEAGCANVYAYTSEGALADGTVHLISDGHNVQPLNSPGLCGDSFSAIDASGENILFKTADPLVPEDQDGVQQDIYDARVDGGFRPRPISTECSGEGCAGAPTVAPALAAPLTTVTSAGENLLGAPAPAKAAPKPKPLTRAQKLAKALKACKVKLNKKRRAKCEALARKQYPKPKPKTKTKRKRA
jgi:hypothetical protein